MDHLIQAAVAMGKQADTRSPGPGVKKHERGGGEGEGEEREEKEEKKGGKEVKKKEKKNSGARKGRKIAGETVAAKSTGSGGKGRGRGRGKVPEPPGPPFADISSAEEAKTKQVKKRRDKKPRPNRKLAVAPVPICDLPSVRGPAGGTVEVVDISRLAELHTHLSTSTCSKSRCVGTASSSSSSSSSSPSSSSSIPLSLPSLSSSSTSSSSSSSSSLSKGEVDEDEDEDEEGVGEDAFAAAPESAHLSAMMLRMPAAKLTLEITGHSPGPGDLSRMLQDNRVLLPLVTASFESEQLGESGRHVDTDGKTRTFPPCIANRECRGMIDPIRMLPILSPPLDSATKALPATRRVLQSFMYEHQLRVFRTSNVAPKEAGYCILCLRANATTIVLARRGNPDATAIAPGLIVQYSRAIPNVPGGYMSEYLLTREGGKDDGLADCMPMYRPNLLYWYRNAQGRWMVDQSAQVWKPPATSSPRIGETLGNF